MQTLLLTWNPGPGNDQQWSPDEWHQDMVVPTEAGGRVDNDWSIWANRTTVAWGDRVYLLRQGPHGRGIVATGWVTSSSYAGPDWRDPDSDLPIHYIDVSWTRCLPLSEMITPSDLQAIAPEFSWTAVYSSGRRLDESVAEKAGRIWEERAGGPPPPPQQPVLASGHFGDTETNAQVEEAAMSEVTTAYQAEGYDVEDVSAQNLGWDLNATRGQETLHVEVKGTSGIAVGFWLTANEHRHARLDDKWVLVAVTSALTDPQIWVIDPEQVVQQAAPYVYRVQVPFDYFE